MLRPPPTLSPSIAPVPPCMRRAAARGGIDGRVGGRLQGSAVVAWIVSQPPSSSAEPPAPPPPPPMGRVKEGGGFLESILSLSLSLSSLLLLLLRPCLLRFLRLLCKRVALKDLLCSRKDRIAGGGHDTEGEEGSIFCCCFQFSDGEGGGRGRRGECFVCYRKKSGF